MMSNYIWHFVTWMVYIEMLEKLYWNIGRLYLSSRPPLFCRDEREPHLSLSPIFIWLGEPTGLPSISSLDQPRSFARLDSPPPTFSHTLPDRKREREQIYKIQLKPPAVCVLFLLFQVITNLHRRRRSEGERWPDLKAARSLFLRSGGGHRRCRSKEQTVGLQIQRPRSNSNSGAWVHAPPVAAARGSDAPLLFRQLQKASSAVPGL